MGAELKPLRRIAPKERKSRTPFVTRAQVTPQRSSGSEAGGGGGRKCGREQEQDLFRATSLSHSHFIVRV